MHMNSIASQNSMLGEVSSYYVWLAAQKESHFKHLPSQEETEALVAIWHGILNNLLAQGQNHLEDAQVAFTVASGIARVARAPRSDGYSWLKKSPICVPLLLDLIAAHAESDCIVNEAMWALSCLDIATFRRVCADNKRVHRGAVWALAMLPAIRDMDVDACIPSADRRFFAEAAIQVLEVSEVRTAKNCIQLVGNMMGAHLPDTCHEEASRFVEPLVKVMWWQAVAGSVAHSLGCICRGNNAACAVLRNHRSALQEGLKNAAYDIAVRDFAMLCALVGGVAGMCELLESYLEYPTTVENLLVALLDLDEPMSSVLPYVVKVLKRYSEGGQQIVTEGLKVVGRVAQFAHTEQIALDCITILRQATHVSMPYSCRWTAFGSLCEVAAQYPQQCRLEMDFQGAKGSLLSTMLRMSGILHGPQYLVTYLKDASPDSATLPGRFLSCCYAWWELEDHDDGILRADADCILAVVMEVLDRISLTTEMVCAAATILAYTSAYCTVSLEPGISRMVQLASRLPLAGKGYYSPTLADALAKLLHSPRAREAAPLLMKLETARLLGKWVRDHPNNLTLQCDVLLMLGMITQEAMPIVHAMDAFRTAWAVQCGGCKAFVELYRLGYQYPREVSKQALEVVARAETLEACAGNTTFRTHAAAAVGVLESFLK